MVWLFLQGTNQGYYAWRRVASQVQVRTSVHLFRMMQHLDLRCVLLSDPSSTVGAGCPNQNTSRIQHKEAHFDYGINGSFTHSKKRTPIWFTGVHVQAYRRSLQDRLWECTPPLRPSVSGLITPLYTPFAPQCIGFDYTPFEPQCIVSDYPIFFVMSLFQLPGVFLHKDTAKYWKCCSKLIKLCAIL